MREDGHLTPVMSVEGATAERTGMLVDRRHVPAARLALSAARLPAMPLLLAVVAIAASVIGITGRGPFFDEGIYLVAGKTLVFRGENWINATYQSWFMGSPFVFPVMAGVVQWLGGDVVAVRVVNVGFLLVAVWGAYKVIVTLDLGRRAALLGAASFGLAGTVLFTGGFATYDTPALAFSVLSIWLLLKGTAAGRVRPVSLLGAGALFGVAVLTKYVVIALAPLIPAVLLVRLWPDRREPLHLSSWRRPVLAGVLTGAPALVIVGSYILYFWDDMQRLWGLQGAHLTNYGATPAGILFALTLYAGPAWLLALIGTELVRPERATYRICLVLLSGSLIMPAYHMWKVDPLSIFKQVGWSLALVAPMVGVALASFQRRPWAFVLVCSALVFISLYHIVTLRSFYPDTRPAAAWLTEHVDPTVDPILVDATYPYRFALADTFDRREWWVVDQWWWFTQPGTPELWRGLIGQGTFSYIVFERGGSFSGQGSVFDESVIEAVEQSGRYRLVASFPSRVTWGNSILPPPFGGQLRPYGIVITEIWQRDHTPGG